MNNGTQSQQSQALVPVETSTHALALVPTSIDGAYQLAAWLSNAQLLPPALRGKQADLFTMILAGMELGLPPMAALRGMYIVNGKPALEGKTKAAICLQRGAALYFKRIEHTPEATTWETMRAGQTEPVRSRYTKQEAKAAGLLDKEGPWRNYSQRMISHRALGWLCDDVYPDIVLGVATAEDFDTEDQVTFRPIAQVGPDVELGAARPSKPAGPTPPPSAPATAKPANPKTWLEEEQLVEIEKAMRATKTIGELKKVSTDLVPQDLDDVPRARLLEVFKDQWALLEQEAVASGATP